MTNDEREVRLKEIEARSDAASPGPWVEAYGGRAIQSDEDKIVCDARRTVSSGNTHWTEWANDRTFISHARHDVPWLLKQVAELEAVLRDCVLDNAESHDRVRAEYRERIGREIGKRAPKLSDRSTGWQLGVFWTIRLIDGMADTIPEEEVL